MTVATAAPQRHVEHCMGTVFSIDVRSPVTRSVVDDVVRWLHRVDAMFSTYRPGSEISRLGRGELALSDCTADVTEVLTRCSELTEESDGRFDVWATGALDPSGYVKGWAIERASDLLVAAGAEDHCINGGGDIQCRGRPAPGQDWRIGIADPSGAGRTVGVLTGTELAVATSGTAERGRHVVDPHTGHRPGTYASITVAGRRLADTDAWATAAFAAGEDAEAWLSARGLTALLVRPDGRCVVS